MIAQRYPEKKIVAIDIDPHAFEAARHNVHSSAWAERIRVELAPLEQYALSQSCKLFSDIICNPPISIVGKLRKACKEPPLDTLNNLAMKLWHEISVSYFTITAKRA
ncbi:hypothetical protein JCM19233_1681 [Vibrio astriarenae]|nr:hypothetical protein JCM19233_1681 [Vibrio sp. C7]